MTTRQDPYGAKQGNYEMLVFSHESAWGKKLSWAYAIYDTTTHKCVTERRGLRTRAQAHRFGSGHMWRLNGSA